jgi:B12 binding domain
LDLQVFRQPDYSKALDDRKPDAVGFSLNYLANIPEVIDLAKDTKWRLPECSVFAGGHIASFNAKEILAHAEGAIACVVRGEGEARRPEAALHPQAPNRGPGPTWPSDIDGCRIIRKNVAVCQLEKRDRAPRKNQQDPKR